MFTSDYQSFIYFRAVSHKKKRVYKSVTCHRFLSSLLLEPVCWVTPVTRVFCFFVEGSVTPVTHRHCEKNGYLFLLPSTICVIDQKANFHHHAITKTGCEVLTLAKAESC